ncbi:hypothetical protein [Rhizobium phage RHph_X2_24]|nr:hypothetical protein [Rhizobium phage RHph_X2_24]
MKKSLIGPGCITGMTLNITGFEIIDVQFKDCTLILRESKGLRMFSCNMQNCRHVGQGWKESFGNALHWPASSKGIETEDCTDIVDRLRQVVTCGCDDGEVSAVTAEAAAEIERLREAVAPFAKFQDVESRADDCHASVRDDQHIGGHLNFDFRWWTDGQHSNDAFKVAAERYALDQMPGIPGENILQIHVRAVRDMIQAAFIAGSRTKP